jgi:hypothetical protein
MGKHHRKGADTHTSEKALVKLCVQSGKGESDARWV